MIPVVFFQVFRKNTVDTAIGLASKTNDVILIADKDYSKGKCRYIKASIDLAKEWIHFQRINVLDDFESICMYRWVCILDAMRTSGIDMIWACDSDVLVFENSDAVYDRLGRPELTISLCPQSRNLGVEFPPGHMGHAFISREAIEMFVGTKHKHHNDVLAWTNLVLDRKLNTLDSAEIKYGYVLDHHLCADVSNYESVDGIKSVRFSKGLPTLNHKATGVATTPVLHCWYKSEPLLPSLAKQIDYV